MNSLLEASVVETGQWSFSSEQSVGEALTLMARAFAAAGIESARRDARFLLQGLMGLDGAQLLTSPERRLGPAAERIGAAVRRRLAHEPVARILGMREFFGRAFAVTPDVLDPRPDSESVIELALEILRRENLVNRPVSIADIGTGSGILIATLLKGLSFARGIATDVSPAALAIARRNAESLGVSGRVTFIATSGLDGCEGPFDLVVSNPPYIPTTQIPALEPDVRLYDPHIALDGGPDGLEVYRDIARSIAALRHGAKRLVLEVGADQASEVEDLFCRQGWQRDGRRADLGGHIRAVALKIHC